MICDIIMHPCASPTCHITTPNHCIKIYFNISQVLVEYFKFQILVLWIINITNGRKYYLNYLIFCEKSN